MIEAVRSGKGQPRVNVICDVCSRGETIPCDYERVGGGQPGKPNEGQAIRKMEGKGWSLVKGKLHCATCEARRKAASAKGLEGRSLELATAMIPAKELPPLNLKMESEPMAEVATKEPGLRRPTPAQKRQIIGLLEDAYDDDAKRYRNPSDNDKVIAETVGGGCMWGWVAEIREELFGPDTRNAEMDAIRAEVKRAEGQIGNLMGEARKLEDALSALKARLDKVA